MRTLQQFWFGLEVSPARLALFRIAFFGILGVDAFLQVAHAPRYGFHDFNVAHFAVLGSLAAGRVTVLVAYVLQSYLAFRIAVGAFTRATLVALALLWGATYFVSQLDSYQHHYLIFLVLGITCVFPWRGGNAWPVRLLLCQISVVYLFAAIAKLDPLWLDGHTLQGQVSAGWLRERLESIGWNTAAIAIILTELGLAVAIHLRRLRPVAFAVGIGFHLAIELAGFKIGLFTYFMIAIYLLLVPGRWLEPVAARLARWRRPARLDAAGAGALAIAVAIVAAASSALALLPVDGVVAIAALAAAAGVTGIAAARRRPLPVALGHAAACALVMVTASASDAARDYHRYWASALRDSGQPERALPLYERAVAIDPDFAQGHTGLGNLYRRLGRYHDALARFEIAKRLEPDNWRAHAGEALTAEALGDHDRARAAAQRTLELNPNQRDARRILSSP